MRHLKRTFAKPLKRWEKQRIIDEKKLMTEYAYKNKKDLWKMKSELSRYREFAKKLVSIRTPQQVKERDEFLKSLYNKGLINEKSVVEDVLALTIKDVSERRLQTVIFRKGIARTPKHARQLIVHGHVKVNNNTITAPSYTVLREEEGLIKIAGINTGGKQ